MIHSLGTRRPGFNSQSSPTISRRNGPANSNTKWTCSSDAKHNDCGCAIVPLAAKEQQVYHNISLTNVLASLSYLLKKRRSALTHSKSSSPRSSNNNNAYDEGLSNAIDCSLRVPPRSGSCLSDLISFSSQPWVCPQGRYATTTHIRRARNCQQRCAECENQSLSTAHRAHRPSTTSHRQLAAWSSGMILALGARRPGLNSQSSSVGENHIDAECQDVLAFHT